MKLNLAISKYLSCEAKVDNIDPATVTVNYDKYRNRTVTSIEFSHINDNGKKVFNVGFKGQNLKEQLTETYITVNVDVNLDNKYFR